MNRRNFLACAAVGNTMLSPARLVLAGTRASYFPDVPLRTQEGKSVRFYNDLVKDKIVVLNFMFTGCSDICPGMTQNLVEVQTILSGRVGRSIFMYSLTLQPEFDTPEVLKAYAEAFGVGPGWLFLTGTSADLDLLRRKLGFADSDPVLDADRTQHIGLVRFGNDSFDRWAACPALTEPEEMAREILWMERKI